MQEWRDWKGCCLFQISILRVWDTRTEPFIVCASRYIFDWKTFLWLKLLTKSSEIFGTCIKQMDFISYTNSQGEDINNFTCQISAKMTASALSNLNRVHFHFNYLCVSNISSIDYRKTFVPVILPFSLQVWLHYFVNMFLTMSEPRSSINC